MLFIVCMNAQNKYAKIVVFRNENNKENEEDSYRIYTDENLTTSLRNYHFEEFYMPEGSFKLKVNEIYPPTVIVRCKAGQTYYFRINRDLSLPDKSIIIVAVDSISASNEIKLLKRYFVSKPGIIKLHRNNGVGVIFEPGVGFEKIGMISTTDGMQVMHSFGGGVSFGLTFLHKFSDYFGWSAALSRQFSILNPPVTNASVVFNQGVLSTTPFLTIPVIKRNKQNIRIGGGLDYHFNPVLTIETEELLGGFNDKWTYKYAFGYHLICFYEVMFTSKVSGHFGFKYTDVKYSYIMGEKYQPYDPRLLNPRGNALSASLGIEYRF